MPSEHAVLSPSAAERWLECPASVRMAEKVPAQPESIYAAEGTACHALAALEVEFEFDLVDHAHYMKELREWRHAYGELYNEDEMRPHVESYIELIRERLERNPGSRLFVEQRVPTGVPRCWGTSDVIIVSPEHIEVVDLKYGTGVRVEASGNPQLRLYGVGALTEIGEMLFGDLTDVFITVFQPRLSHVDTEHMKAEDLVRWRDEEVVPLAEEALSEGARFGPSETACRWCPASGRCKAQLEQIFAEPYEEVDADVVTNDELAEALARIGLVKRWLEDVQVVALDRAYAEGETVPGYKVVMSGGRRAVVDPEGAMDALSLVGYDLDDVAPRKIKGIGDLEKLLKKDFDAVMSQFVEKGEGRPSLVLESDKRPSINPNSEAAREFKENPA